jgi:amino acid transporter
MTGPADPSDAASETDESRDAAEKLKRLLLGAPKSLKDPGIFHRLALVAFLAWVGLGADGLSSSAYGPEEAYRQLGEHKYLAVVLAVVMAITVFTISWSYSRIIEAFPSGGGGYVVSYKLLGSTAGVVSGSALLVDYVLTISISIAAGADAALSYLPAWVHGLKLVLCSLAIGVLLILNLRGVKESVTILAPIFMVFIVTHVVAIGAALLGNLGDMPAVAAEVTEGFQEGYAALGLGGLALIFLRAYSIGGGTYTGIEAVANGMQVMRQPAVKTARRTMVYMSISLAVTATGLLVGYLLTDVQPAPGRTMNAVLVDTVVGGWNLGEFPIGRYLATITLASEAALLVVAAQAGFIDGPRVMANMAIDSWLPHRFAALSDRLTIRNGIWLMGLAALATLFYTKGNVRHLVVLYAINVFLTFSLSNIAMLTRAFHLRRSLPRWRKDLGIHLFATILCVSILGVTIYEKFETGGWVTLTITSMVVIVCVLIRRHYAQVKVRLVRLRRLATELANMPTGEHAPPAIDPLQPTAVLLVGAFGGVGVHSLLSIFRFFPDYFKNVVFVTIGVIDSGNFKGREELEALEASTKRTVYYYVDLANRLGIASEGIYRIGTDTVDEAEKVCEELARKYPRHMFFGGKLVFHKERWYERLLHNETAFAIQRRLQWKGHPMTVLPVRVME